MRPRSESKKRDVAEGTFTGPPGVLVKQAETTKPDLLIVDDDPLITDTLNFVLSRDFSVYVADSRAQVKSLLRQLDRPPQLALIDLGLPPTPHRPDEGFRLISELIAYSAGIKIVVLSGQTMKPTRACAHARCVEFVAKPAEPETLKNLLKRALEIRDAELGAAADSGLIGKSPPIDKLRQQVAQFADAPFPVLIEGESGSGKELVAKSLHLLSTRSSRPFLVLNCAAISPNCRTHTLRLRSRLVPGATTRVRATSRCEGSTLFLDEMGNCRMSCRQSSAGARERSISGSARRGRVSNAR